MTNDELDDHRTNITNGIYGDDRMSRHDMDKAFDSLRAVCDAIEDHNALMETVNRKLDDIEVIVRKMNTTCTEGAKS